MDMLIAYLAIYYTGTYSTRKCDPNSSNCSDVCWCPAGLPELSCLLDMMHNAQIRHSKSVEFGSNSIDESLKRCCGVNHKHTSGECRRVFIFKRMFFLMDDFDDVNDDQ